MFQPISASAVGKVILIGEHAAVYSRPAIALPVRQVAITVQIRPTTEAADLHINAPQIGLDASLGTLPAGHPLRNAIERITSLFALPTLSSAEMDITSTIPVAAGMGSSAALAVGLTRAMLAYFGRAASVEEVSEAAFEIEKHQHGTPSGLDNSVIAHERCVYFQKDQPIEYLRPGKDFRFVIANSGISASTKEVVASVRNQASQNPEKFTALFDRIGGLSQHARTALESGQEARLGLAMNDCHAVLKELTVSSAELDDLVSIACQAGALGAKLSGGGRGGAMIALVTNNSEQAVISALAQAGAVDVISMTLDGAED